MMASQDLSTQASDILVVDDNIANLRMLTDILKKAGYKPRPVEDPRAALEAALAQPPSLILLDVRMPGMSGFELCRRLKHEERTCDVPLIFVSALEDTEDRVQGFKVGGVDFVTKPVQEAEVLARVKTHLQLRNRQLHLEALVAERTAELEKLLAVRSAALDSAENQIRILFESTQVGIGLTTLEGEILSANQALLRMTGYSKAEIQQLNVRELYLEPAQRAILLKQLQEAGAVQEFGIQIVRKDGTSFYASLNVSKLARTEEERDVLLAVIEDVTEQISAEQDSAVLKERARLARDLHDAVTQTLFSASLLADTTPRIWERDQAMARQNLNQLGRLVRGALAEMRTLLFELRTDAIQDQALGQLLHPLVEAARARARATVDLRIQGECDMPENVTMALHRIAQESLNNVAKHAEARSVNVDLDCSPERVVLRVSDDGRGFDPEHIPPGHMGISIMKERAQAIGAIIEIESQRGHGTQVAVTWSDQGEGNEDD